MAYFSKDYYHMEEEELLQVIRDLREWLWKFAGHEKWWYVWFALEVACNARDLLEDKKTDPFLQDVLDTMT